MAEAAVKGSAIRLTFRVLLLSLWIALMVSWYFITWLLRVPNRQRIACRFHRGCCRLFGIEVVVIGNTTQTKPTLFVGNHISYLDVFALGGHLPGYFVAKSEVAHWPLFGQLARLQNTVFIERRASRAVGQVRSLQHVLANGENLILFPEGTSTPGVEVLPFKSALFKAADLPDTQVTIQPLSISYTHCQGRAMSQQQRDLFAWYLPMPFLSHFLTMLSVPGVRAEIRLQKPVHLQEFASRKQCAAYCQQQVAAGLAASLASGEDNDPSTTADQLATGHELDAGSELAGTGSRPD